LFFPSAQVHDNFHFHENCSFESLNFTPKLFFQVFIGFLQIFITLVAPCLFFYAAHGSEFRIWKTVLGFNIKRELRNKVSQTCLFQNNSFTLLYKFWYNFTKALIVLQFIHFTEFILDWLCWFWKTPESVPGINQF
jgi:hypothetical protein